MGLDSLNLSLLCLVCHRALHKSSHYGFQGMLRGCSVNIPAFSNPIFSSYLATRFKGIRHFLMIGGLLVALLGGVLIFALPESNRVGRLM